MTLEEKLGEIERQRRDISSSSSKQGMTRKIPQDSETCPVCGGMEWVLSEEGGVLAAAPCRCRKKNLMERRLRFADIPEAFREMLCQGIGRGKAYGLGLMTILHGGSIHG